MIACLAVLTLGGSLLADDHEDPIEPTSAGKALTAFGTVEVEPQDVGGLCIDAKETIEPQTTAMLIMEDVSISPGQVLAVQMSPVFESWVQWSEGGW